MASLHVTCIVRGATPRHFIAPDDGRKRYRLMDMHTCPALVTLGPHQPNTRCFISKQVGIHTIEAVRVDMTLSVSSLVFFLPNTSSVLIYCLPIGV